MTRKKTRTKATTIPAPQSPAETSVAIRRIGEVQRELVRLETVMNDELAAAKSRREEAAAPLKAELKGLEKGVQTYCEAHRDELTNEGRSKSHRFGAGLVRWRATPSKVSIKGKEAVLAIVLASRRFRLFVRTTHDIDKEAMLKAPDLAREIKGVKISGGEQFEIEPFGATLDQEATE